MVADERPLVLGVAADDPGPSRFSGRGVGSKSLPSFRPRAPELGGSYDQASRIVACSVDAKSIPRRIAVVTADPSVPSASRALTVTCFTITLVRG
jgi:hypothetical protein